MLNEKGIETKKHSIENDEIAKPEVHNKLIGEADIVGFAYPIYGSDIPENFMAFIDNLQKVDKKPAFVFTTMLLFSGDGAVVAKRRLRRRGFKVKQAINIKMPNNVKLPYPIFRSLAIRNEPENDKVKQKAVKKAAKLVDRIITGKNWVQGWDLFNIAGGLMQRVEMRRIDMSKFARNYFVEKEACTECMQCVDYCPVNNIKYEDGEFTWLRKCVLCLRCYHMCLEDAIQYKKATLNKEKYTRYKGPGNGFNVNQLKK
jgi:ferredoxin